MKRDLQKVMIIPFSASNLSTISIIANTNWKTTEGVKKIQNNTNKIEISNKREKICKVYEIN